MSSSGRQQSDNADYDQGYTHMDRSLMQLGGSGCIRRLLDRAKESNHSESESCKRQSRPQPRERGAIEGQLRPVFRKLGTLLSER
jgi:hypothetical protein